MTDLILAIAHHLFVFSLVAIIAAGLVLVRDALGGAALRRLGSVDLAYGVVAAGVGRDRRLRPGGPAIRPSDLAHPALGPACAGRAGVLADASGLAPCAPLPLGRSGAAAVHPRLRGGDHRPMRVSTAEFIKNYGALADRALAEPVMITKHGQDRLVVISAAEYSRLKQRDRRVLRAENWTDAELAMIEAAEVPAEYEHLDAELKDWRP
jgi:PHD/YefM family antitoxin component YafN of YafNO toxin-antitoxin module